TKLGLRCTEVKDVTVGSIHQKRGSSASGWVLFGNPVGATVISAIKGARRAVIHELGVLRINRHRLNGRTPWWCHKRDRFPAVATITGSQKTKARGNDECVLINITDRQICCLFGASTLGIIHRQISPGGTTIVGAEQASSASEHKHGATIAMM